jgi:hypothetical protein
VEPAYLGPVNRASPCLRTESVDGAQLSGLRPKTTTESSLRNVVLNKNRTMDNVQKHSNCTVIRSYIGHMWVQSSLANLAGGPLIENTIKMSHFFVSVVLLDLLYVMLLSTLMFSFLKHFIMFLNL